jgi:hypothetical protein
MSTLFIVKNINVHLTKQKNKNMKKQILSKEFKIGDIITIPNSDVNLGDEGKIIKVYTDYNSIPKKDIGNYELDIDAYEEEDEK